LSKAVERVGQKTTALRESVGETWQKIKGNSAETPKRKNYNEPNSEFLDTEFGVNKDLVDINPADLRYSQRKAGGNGRADKLRESMKDGWDYSREPVDVIKTEKGFETFDNTRPAVAVELGLKKIQAKIRQIDEPLPGGFAYQRDLIQTARRNKLPTPKTWGEAFKVRTKSNRIPFEGRETIDLAGRDF
jgi:hypothetical protein